MAAMSMAALCSSNAEVNEAGVLNHVAGRKNKKAAGTDRAHIIHSASAPSTSSSCSGTARCWPSSQRWCKESLTAMETHLALLQQSQTPAINAAKLCRAPGPLKPQRDLATHLGTAASAQLPHGWEQHLDLRTGRIYYINWETCKRSYNDPRKALQSADEMINKLMQQAALINMAEGKDSINHEEKLQSSVTQELNGVCGYSNNLINILKPCSLSKDDEEMEVESKWKPNEELADRCSGDELGHTSSDDMVTNDRNKDNLNDSINFLPSLMRTSGRGHHWIASNELDAMPELEALSCHHCLSHIIIHIANPWCPLCGLALV